VVVLTKTLALELGQYGITVNTIPPRAVITPMFMAAPFAQGPDGEEHIRRMGDQPAVPLNGTIWRPVSPESCPAADAVLQTTDSQPVNIQFTGDDKRPQCEGLHFGRITPAVRCRALHSPVIAM
jgi:NAD(P)-dependent dehydrogenase (short-subunit alcohol dehydrogenase family)